MKLEINIDEKEFGIDIADHFQDFFKRLQAEIKSRLVSNDTLVCGNYELEIVEMLLTAFKNATIEQEPKTVLYIGDGYADGEMVYDMAECPNCGYEYENGDKDCGLPFCPSCGQKLNWENEG